MEPITRSEMLMDGQYVEPKTRKEKILAGEDLEPITREEYFLKKYRHSGGDVDVVQLTATENKTYTAPEGKAYSPVKVNVPTDEPVLGSIEINENGHFTPPAGTDGYDDITVYVPYVTQGTTINENGDYTPPAGVDGFGRVIVDVPTPPPSLQSLTASHNGYFLPSSGYVGFSEVNVDVALPQNAYLLESQKDDVVTIQHGAEFDMPKLIASIEPQQSGSGEPSPENVRPISGWTACNVVRTGKNLYDGVSNIILDKPVPYGTKIYIQVFEGSFAGATLYGKSYDTDFVALGSFNRTKNVITINRNDITQIKISPSALNDLRVYGSKLMVSFTDFESYEPFGNTYTINFVDGSSPLTVYGGTIDVLSGLLTVDRKFIDVSSMASSVGYNSGVGAGTLANTGLKANITSETLNEYISNCLKAHINSGVASMNYEFTVDANSGLLFKIPNCTSASDYQTWLGSNNLHIVGALATPQTYQLTPTEVKSLLGVNNIFADTGEVDVQIWTKEV